MKNGVLIFIAFVAIVLMVIGKRFEMIGESLREPIFVSGVMLMAVTALLFVMRYKKGQ